MKLNHILLFLCIAVLKNAVATTDGKFIIRCRGSANVRWLTRRRVIAYCNRHVKQINHEDYIPVPLRL